MNNQDKPIVDLADKTAELAIDAVRKHFGNDTPEIQAKRLAALNETRAKINLKPLDKLPDFFEEKKDVSTHHPEKRKFRDGQSAAANDWD